MHNNQEPRPRKRQRKNSDSDVTITATAAAKHPDSNPDNGEAQDGGESTGRACENCRRSKLRCSRTQPCTKCVAKRAECVYEESDKKRGPRPGYIEGLNGRMDTLEKLVLGQSLLFRGNDRTPTSVAALQKALQQERERLLELAESRLDAPADDESQIQEASRGPLQQIPPLLLHPPPVAPGPTSKFAAIGPTAGKARSPASTRSHVALSDVVYTQSPSSPPPLDVFLQVSEFYEQHLQPWLPVMPWPETTPRLQQPHLTWPPPPLSRVAASKPSDKPAHVVFSKSANMDQMRVSMLLQFILFGKGRATEVWALWGIGMHLAQVVVRTGLHLEDPHVTPAHYMQRRLLASMVSLQPFGDFNLGAYAYLIEATEVLTTVSAFAVRYGGVALGVNPRPDVRLFLKEFLELDSVLTNWKARLPVKYHHASYDEDGYMDHNLTLAHMTHNTSSILLYQSPRALFGLGAPGEALHRTLLPQCAIIKHGAKEIGRICTRFLFHRRYLVSPQFAFCQFSAARALLAYASWTGETVDEEYETLFTALAESAKRWAGVGHNHESSAEMSRLDNFAAMLHSRLKYDFKRPAAIDLTLPAVQLLEDAGIAPGVGNAQVSGVSPGYASGIPAECSPEMDNISGGRGAAPQVSSNAAGLLQSFVGGPEDEHHTVEVHNSEQLDDVLAQMALSGPESLDARLFSWEKDPTIEWPAESEGLLGGAPQ
ncbi:hypothetical protein F5X68DRAFT_227171 [Plectosphaerella plurivora]|uniref:Zn(2)-C6 fungal-type domain-containing protein n=1 Tax=Plectosphaerella plurivora TaxID=936078 RepID=A0A9P9AFD2_9PEZI|nr:hypothetical protein F5X68DRAFT_227171 [Plectosphaerella plurivora]